MCATVSSESKGVGNNVSISDAESESSIEMPIKSSEDDSDSDAEQVIKNNKYVPPSGLELAIRSFDQPSCSQSNVSQQNNDSRPNIGTITMQNSAHPMFGNKTFYKGPVTINQFITDGKSENTWKKAKSNEYKTTEFMGNSTSEPDQPANDPPPNDMPNDDQSERIEENWINEHQKLIKWSIALILMIALLAVGVYFIRKNYNEPVRRIVPYLDWHVLPPSKKLHPLDLPAARVIILDTFSQNCSDKYYCDRLVQNIPKYFKNWFELKDVDCNFLIGGEGTVYVWRGWDIQAEHTPYYNIKSICIALIGTFVDIEPPTAQLDATQQLIEEGVKLKKLIPDYKLYGQRQLASTPSPGEKLYHIIQKWEHWTDERNYNILN